MPPMSCVPQLTPLASRGWLLAAPRTQEEPGSAAQRPVEGSGAPVRPGQAGQFRRLPPPQAQQEKVAPAEYRAFIRTRLVQPSTPLAYKLPVAEEVMGRLTQLGGEIGGGLRSLGEGFGNGVVFERVANALKDMTHPAIDGARALAPGGGAGVGK